MHFQTHGRVGGNLLEAFGDGLAHPHDVAAGDGGDAEADCRPAFKLLLPPR